VAESSKKVLVALRTYNDIDHIVPIIWKAADEGHQIVVVCVSRYNFRDDYRIKYLTQFKNIKFHYIFEEARLFRLLKYNFITILFYLVLTRVDTFLVEWWKPNFRSVRGQIFLAFRILGRKRIAVPHGYNVYLNEAINGNVQAKLASNIKMYENRNSFSNYIVATDFQLKQIRKYGISNSISMSLGSVRFSSEWHEVLSNLERENEVNFSLEGCDDDDELKVCFMTPHWDYHVDKEMVFKLLESILVANKKVRVLIKEHTRGTGGLSNEEAQIFDRFKDQITFVKRATSFQVIKNSDIIIAVGTSIIFEAMIQGKAIINPKYVHSNTTIFDQAPCVYQAESVGEVNNTISKLFTEKTKGYNYDDFLFRHVYNSCHTSPLSRYFEIL
jgi:hypothetical protein